MTGRKQGSFGLTCAAGLRGPNIERMTYANIERMIYAVQPGRLL